VIATLASVAEANSVPAHTERRAGTSETVLAHRAGTNDDVLAQIADVLAQVDQRAGTSAQIAGTGWRIEVVRRGKYWQSRRGRGKNRESRYGGKFSTLSEERQAQYYVNRQRYHERRTRVAGASRDC
jgi:hypothetical protein